MHLPPVRRFGEAARDASPAAPVGDRTPAYAKPAGKLLTRLDREPRLQPVGDRVSIFVGMLDPPLFYPSAFAEAVGIKPRAARAAFAKGSWRCL